MTRQTPTNHAATRRLDELGDCAPILPNQSMFEHRHSADVIVLDVRGARWHGSGRGAAVRRRVQWVNRSPCTASCRASKAPIELDRKRPSPAEGGFRESCSDAW